MKILLLNISNNVVAFNTVASGETVYLKKMLEKNDGVEVVIASNKGGEYTVPFEEIGDVNNFDKVVILPGSLNFFGGVESPTIMNNYKLLAKWKGEAITVLQTDARLPFRQLWPAIEKRDWGYSKEDVWVSSKIHVVCQSKKVDEVKSQYNKKDVEFKNIDFTHFPIEQYAAIVAAEEQENLKDNIEKEHDLVYYGSFRGGNRAEKMVDFLTGEVAEELNVHVFGTLKEKQLAKVTENKLPTFGKKIKMNETIKEVSKSFSTIIIGEKFYNDAMLTVRVWETLSSQSVVFIDDDFDSEHEIFPDNDFRYVKSGKELTEKIKMLNDELIEKLLIEQKDTLNKLINKEKYITGLKSVLK